MARCLLLALSGLAEMVCKLSTLRGEADMRDRVTSTSSVAIDPLLPWVAQEFRIET
jgi:hypothetical protein